MKKSLKTLSGMLPGLALLSQRGQSQSPESSIPRLSEKQERLQAVALQLIQGMGNGGLLPIPSSMAEPLITQVIPTLTDEQIEQGIINLIEKAEWVLSGNS